MDDHATQCPACGAANPAFVREAKQTPKTIAELEDWYKARNLPPYETTRFFIGIDYKKPKAFGIYKDGSGDFVVYKNKADGSRAIRYRGKDEAYAVNELYLRLKEEILNQKNNSAHRKTQQHSGVRSTGSQQAGGCGKGCLIPVLIAVGVVVTMLITGLISMFVDSFKPQAYGYYTPEDAKGAYYYAGMNSSLANTQYEWWYRGMPEGEWTLQDRACDENGFIDGLGKKQYSGDDGSLWSMLEDFNIDASGNYDEYYKLYDATEARAYKDIHHRHPGKSSYYYVDGRSYYYLDDRHGESYGNGDNSGWYIFGDSGWEYYCDGNDRDALGDDLWYDDDRYEIGDNYDDYKTYVSGDAYYFSDSEAAAWTADSFSDTTWFEEAEAADAAYDKYWEEKEKESSSSSSSSSSDWSSDSSWDWDSGSDSWDSSSTDWDSDW